MGRHSLEFLSDVMRRESMAAILKDAEDKLRSNPDGCVVVGNNSMVMVRVGDKKRVWVSVRALLWMRANRLHYSGYPEPPLFGLATCGVPGCCNPAHQRPREETPERVRLVNAQPV